MASRTCLSTKIIVAIVTFLFLYNIFLASAQITSSTTENPTNSTGRPGECTEEGTFPGKNPGEFYMCRYSNPDRTRLTKYPGQCKAEYVKTVFDSKQRKCVLPGNVTATTRELQTRKGYHRIQPIGTLY